MTTGLLFPLGMNRASFVFGLVYMVYIGPRQNAPEPSPPRAIASPAEPKTKCVNSAQTQRFCPVKNISPFNSGYVIFTEAEKHQNERVAGPQWVNCKLLIINLLL